MVQIKYKIQNKFTTEDTENTEKFKNPEINCNVVICFPSVNSVPSVACI